MWFPAILRSTLWHNDCLFVSNLIIGSFRPMYFSSYVDCLCENTFIPVLKGPFIHSKNLKIDLQSDYVLHLCACVYGKLKRIRSLERLMWFSTLLSIHWENNIFAFCLFKFSWECFKRVLGLLTGLGVSGKYDMQRPTPNLSAAHLSGVAKSVSCFSMQW